MLSFRHTATYRGWGGDRQPAKVAVDASTVDRGANAEHLFRFPRPFIDGQSRLQNRRDPLLVRSLAYYACWGDVKPCNFASETYVRLAEILFWTKCPRSDVRNSCSYIPPWCSVCFSTLRRRVVAAVAFHDEQQLVGGAGGLREDPVRPQGRSRGRAAGGRAEARADQLRRAPRQNVRLVLSVGRAARAVDRNGGELSASLILCSRARTVGVRSGCIEARVGQRRGVADREKHSGGCGRSGGALTTARVKEGRGEADLDRSVGAFSIRRTTLVEVFPGIVSARRGDSVAICFASEANFYLVVLLHLGNPCVCLLLLVALRRFFAAPRGMRRRWSARSPCSPSATARLPRRPRTRARP